MIREIMKEGHLLLIPYRSLMRESEQANIAPGDIGLAQEALADAARERFGTGYKGLRKLKKQLPVRGLMFTVEKGHDIINEMANRAISLAAEPADTVNTALGYEDGREAAANIQRSLERLARKNEADGLSWYATQLLEAAKLLENKKTLGEIYELKKTAQAELASVILSKDLGNVEKFAARAKLVSAIRHEVYARYEVALQYYFHSYSRFYLYRRLSMIEIGRKELAAIRFCIGIAKRTEEAIQATCELYRSGRTLDMLTNDAGLLRAVKVGMSGYFQTHGLARTPSCALNGAIRDMIGRLPNWTPEYNLAEVIRFFAKDEAQPNGRNSAANSGAGAKMV
jgi:hypothetical protein